MGDNGSSVTRSKTRWTDSINVPNKNRLPAISLKGVQGNKSARADRENCGQEKARMDFSMASATALGGGTNQRSGALADDKEWRKG